jgi:hypothetical protein
MYVPFLVFTLYTEYFSSIYTYVKLSPGSASIWKSSFLQEVSTFNPTNRKKTRYSAIPQLVLVRFFSLSLQPYIIISNNNDINPMAELEIHEK